MESNMDCSPSLKIELEVPSAEAMDESSNVSCGYKLRPSESIASLVSSCTTTKSELTTKNELLIRLQAAIGIKHVLFTYATHGTLALMIFLNRDLIWYTSVPQSVGVTTTAAVRTKGAVAICFILFGTSILFLSAHFKGKLNK
ncbi:unnamed protein product [Trichobilharzia regenti]|nr:unnamed protein product [Trichobilharzia regenti]